MSLDHIERRDAELAEQSLRRAAQDVVDAYAWREEAWSLPSPPATAELLKGADKALALAILRLAQTLAGGPV